MQVKKLTGARFGRLVVAERAIENTKHGGARWRCLCDCGRETTVSTVNLRNSTVSCGCMKTEQNRALFRKERGHSGLTCLFDRYKRASRVRGHKFVLTRELFQDLTRGACHYCGAVPGRSIVNPSQQLRGDQESRDHSRYTYNGLDRLDNGRGYEPSNVVPCCWPCNQLKGRMDVDAFLRQALAVAAWQATSTS
jgi:5-methylcytosine-specific restriction endonuclease McrA